MKTKNGLTKNDLDALVLLKLVHDHFEEERSLQHPDAPGHAHRVRGRWDKDGSVCEWCKTWDLVRECVKQSEKLTKARCKMNETIAKLNEAKTNKWLDVQVKDAVHGIITRRELLSKELVGKHVTTERYGKRKINLEYKELKTPKVEHWLDMFWRGENYSMKCPKYVWESTVAVVKG